MRWTAGAAGRSGAAVVLSAGAVVALTLAAGEDEVRPTAARDPTALVAAASPAASALPGCRPERRRYRTLPHMRSVKLCVSRRRGSATSAAGRLLLTPRPQEVRPPRDLPGAMIVSNSGQILWFAPHRTQTTDLKVVRYAGRPHLAVYRRRSPGPSHFEILDRRYRRVTRIAAGNGFEINSHDFQLTRHGTAYVMAYVPVWVGGIGHVQDFVLQEIDLDSREVLFEWRALDHVPLWASYDPAPSDGSAWDYFHGNSIEPPTRHDGTIIVSARRTSAVYGIDRATGDVRWILGGKQDSFGLAERDRAWRFCAQHDARRTPDGELTIFDNGGWNLGDERACPAHPARVLRFRLDPEARTARLVRVIGSEPSSPQGTGLRPIAIGSARHQAGGDMLISWGTTGTITQVTRTGRVTFGLHMRGLTYRAVRADGWRGFPAGRPRIVARRSGDGGVRVWASWNGATEIRRWRVLAGPRPRALRPVGRSVEFADLETTMRVATGERFVAARAHDAGGGVLGRSRAVRVR